MFNASSHLDLRVKGVAIVVSRQAADVALQTRMCFDAPGAGVTSDSRFSSLVVTSASLLVTSATLLETSPSLLARS